MPTRRLNSSRWIRSALGSLVAVFGLLTTSLAAHAESTGCAAINEGTWNQTLDSNEDGNVVTLAMSEQVNMTYTGGSGAVRLIGQLGSWSAGTSPGSGSVTIVMGGTYYLQPQSLSDGPVTIVATCIAPKENQTIDFAPQGAQTFSPGGTFAIDPTATASSGLPVSYSSTTTSVCTVSGTTVTMLSAGTCTIAANQAGDGDYNPAPQVTQNVAIGKADQTINFGPQSPQTFSSGGSFAISPAATASSGLPVSYSSTTTSVCTVSGTTVSMLSTGTCTIAANQAGDDDYNAAEQETQDVEIGKGEQTITFGAQSPQAFSAGGSFAISPTASASSGLPVTYSSLTGSVCTVSGTTVTMVAAGTCTIAADQAGDDDWNAAEQETQNVAINKGDQTITFGAQSPQTFSAGGSFAISPTASASSGLAVTYSSLTSSVCTVSGTTVTMLAAGTCTIAADQSGDDDYNAAPQQTQDVEIGKADQTISFTPPAAQPFEPGLTVPLDATATSGLAVTFTSNSTSICTVSGATATILALGTCSITASQDGDTNYNPAQPVTETFEIEQSVTQTTMSFSPSAPLIGQPVTFSVTVTSPGGTPTGTVVLLEGSTPLCTVTLANGTGSCTATFTSAGDHTVLADYEGTSSFATSASTPATATVVDQRGRTTRVIGQFLSQRNNQILSNEPESRRQIDRLQRAGEATAGAGFASVGPSAQGMPTIASGLFGTRMGLGVAGNDNTATLMQRGPQNGGLPIQGGNIDGLMQLSFSGSLSQMRSAAAAAERQRLAEAAPGFASGPVAMAPHFDPFDIWVEGKYAEFNGNGASGGRFGLLSAGFDYVFSPNLLVGVMAQMDSMRLDDDVDPANVSGIGYLIGPYATVRLTDEMFLQARAAWGGSNNEVSPFATYTDDFDTTRWLLAATLTGTWSSGPWRFDPTARIAYMQDTSDSYTDSFGMLIPSVKSELGQLRAGPRIGYRSLTDAGTVIEPYAGADIIWNFADNIAAGLNAVIDDDLVGPTGARGRVELGLRATTLWGTSLDVAGSYDGIGAADYSAWTGRASANIPLN